MQRYCSFYFVVNMHLLWFSSWVFTLTFAGDCGFLVKAEDLQRNDPPRIRVYAYGGGALSDSESVLRVANETIQLGQDWRSGDNADFSLPTAWTKVAFECLSIGYVLEWEVPERAKLSGVQTESIREEHGYSDPPVYLHKSYLILSNITDRLTGDYKCRAKQQQTSSRQLKHQQQKQQQQNQGKTNSFYLFVPNGGNRLAKTNDDNQRQETTIYVATPFTIRISDDKSLVSYSSSSAQFEFFSREGRIEVLSTPNDDKEGNIEVISPEGRSTVYKFIIIERTVYEAKGLKQEECEFNGEIDQDCDFKSFRCQSATVRPPKIHFTPLSEQGCPVQNKLRKENVIVKSCGVGCTKLMTGEPRGIVKCVGDGVEEELSEIRFPFDLYCSTSPYLIDRGSVMRVSSQTNSSVTIPCTGNHPKAPITLASQHRVAPGMIDWLDKPIGVDGVLYDPKQGFIVENNKTNIYGTYMCISDRTLLNWNDHMIVHVESADEAQREFENTNASPEERSDFEDSYEDPAPIITIDEELYIKQNTLQPNNQDPIVESRLADLEYEFGSSAQFICYGSRDVYAWGIYWTMEYENGEHYEVDSSISVSDSAIKSALHSNKSARGNVYSQILLKFPDRKIKALWCHAPIANSPFEWRKVSWPILIVDKEYQDCRDIEQTMRISHLGSTAEALQEYQNDNRITAVRRNYRHFIVPDGSRSLAVMSNAAQPLIWSYEGVNYPHGISVSTYRSVNNFSNVDSYCFASEIRFENLTKEHTGQYIVSHTDEPERKMSFYLFVSSNKPPFFLKPSSPAGNRIPWNQNEGVRLIIPCLVNNPNLRTSLYKQSANQQLQEVTSSFTYDPRRGFTSKISVLTQKEAVGEYVCLARSPSTYSIDKMIINVYADESESQQEQRIYNLGADYNEDSDISSEVLNENMKVDGRYEKLETSIRNDLEDKERPIRREILVECSVSTQYASKGIKWAIRHTDGSLNFIDPLNNHIIEYEDRDHVNTITSQMKGHISNSTKEVTLECFVPLAGRFEWISFSFPIHIFLQ